MPFATFSDELTIFDCEEPFKIFTGIKVKDAPYSYGNITWSGDAVWLAVTPSTDHLPIYKFENNQLVTYKYVNDRNIKSATFLNWTNRDLIYGLETGDIRIWNIKERKISGTIDIDYKQSVNFLACNSDDTCIASASLESNKIGLHSLKTNKFVGTVQLPDGELTSSVRFCQCKKGYIAASSSASTVCVWDVNNSEVVYKTRKAHRGACSAVEFSPVNFSVLITVSLSQQLKMYDLRMNNIIFDVELHEPLHCVDMFQCGEKVAIGTSTGSIIIHDLRANKIHDTMKVHNCVVNAISINKLDKIRGYCPIEIDSPDTPVPSNRTLDLSVMDVFSPVLRLRKSLSTPSPINGPLRLSLTQSQFQNDSFLSKMLSPKPQHMLMSSPIVQESPINNNSADGSTNGGLLPVLEEGSFENSPEEAEGDITEICVESLKNEIDKIQKEHNHLFKTLSEQLSAMEDLFIKKIQSEYDTLVELLLNIIRKNMEKNFSDMRYELVTQRILNAEYFSKLMEKTDNIALILQELLQHLTQLQCN